MLVIPAIELKSDRCVRTIHVGPNDGLVYSDDPLEMAMLWRRENARTLHVLDRDGLYDGSPVNREAIVEIVSRIDIPVQIISAFVDVVDAEAWLAAGVYRIFLHDLLERDPEGVAGLVARFGPSRICAGVIARNGRTNHTWRPDTPERDNVEFAQAAAALGIKRLFFTDRQYEGELHGPNFAELERLATGSGLHVTAAGGVATVEHVWRLQEMETIGIDSVVIGRAFYENSFPCQQLWRDVELERRKAGLEWRDGVSTSSLKPGKPPSV